MPVKFVGRESHFYGKGLFEIARNLKNFGVGRIVTRTKFSKKYDGVSYFRLTHVEPDMNSKHFLKGTIKGQKVFRGVDYGIRSIECGQKNDWILVPKDEEHLLTGEKIIDLADRPKTVVPDKLEIPPLMKIILKSEMEANGMKPKEQDFYANVKTAPQSSVTKEQTAL